MPRLSTKGRRSAAIIASPILLLACLGLAACGSSSSSGTSTTTANVAATSAATHPPAAASTGATGPAGPGASPGGATGPAGPNGGGARFAAVRECLQKNGVTLPQRPAGGGAAHRGPGGFFGAGANGGPTLPKGMTRAQYTEVLKKCGGGFRGGNTFGRGRHAFASPTDRQALTKFAACLRQNGVDIPEPNTSGKGPIFDTKGIDTASPQFRQAEIKCRNDLLSALRPGGRAPGGPTGPAGSGAAGSSAG